MSTDDAGGPAPRVGAPGHEPGHVPHVPLGRYEGGYVTLAMLFIAMLMLTNIIGTKLFALPMDLPLVGGVLRAVDDFIAWLLPGQGGGDALTLTAGIITYPITFLITDIVSETYGRKRADRMVLLGFLASVLMLSVLWVGKSLPPSPFWVVPESLAGVFAAAHQGAGPDGALFADADAAQAAYAFTFDAPGILLFASMTAYLVAQLIDNRLFHFWRRLTAGKHLWFRNNMSTGLSQFVDTAIVNGIFLRAYFGWDWDAIAGVVIAVYVVKFLLALLDTPLCYLGVWAMGRFARSDARAP